MRGYEDVRMKGKYTRRNEGKVEEEEEKGRKRRGDM